MNLVQMLPLVTLSVSLYVAFFHLYMHSKGLGNRSNLSFAWVCLYMGLLAFICLMNYNVSTSGQHLFWVRLFYFSFPLFPAAFVHFAYDFTQQSSNRIARLLTGFCFIEIAAMGLLLVIDTDVRPLLIPLQFIDFSYVGFQGGVLMETMKILIIASAYVIILHGLLLIVRFYRAGNKVALPILYGAALFFLSGLNDTLIELRIYSFLYLAEYGGLFLILGMAYAMINQMREAQQEMNRTRILTVMGRMATEVVHDLTTPLDAIKLAASIARQDSNGADTRGKYLSLIEQETRRLSDLSFDILQFVNKDRSLATREVVLNDYMEEVVFLLQGDFDQQGIKLRFSSEYDGSLLIDPDAFKRVILNLASNARESLIRNETEKPELVISVYKQARQLVFRFIDNGPGVPQELVEHVFDSFTKSDHSHGTGLGLAISKQIVDRHGGALTYEAGHENGAAFRISLPQ